MPKEQGTLAQVLSVQEQVIGREESETSHQELPLNFPNQQTTSPHESSVSAGFEGVAEPCSSETSTEKDEDCSFSNHNVAIATHAILLEFGFIGFDLKSGMKVDQFHPPTDLPSNIFTMWYTLPGLLLPENVGAESIEGTVFRRYRQCMWIFDQGWLGYTQGVFEWKGVWTHYKFVASKL